jgi:hypothetical protein
VTDNRTPKLPPEGEAPVSLGAEKPKPGAKPKPRSAGLRLSAEQFVRAKGLRKEHWPGFLEECRQKYQGERHTVPSWDVIYRRFQDRPVK